MSLATYTFNILKIGHGIVLWPHLYLTLTHIYTHTHNLTLLHTQTWGGNRLSGGGGILWVTPCKARNGKIFPPRLPLMWWALLLGSGEGVAVDLNVCVREGACTVCFCSTVVLFLFSTQTLDLRLTLNFLVNLGHQDYIFLYSDAMGTLNLHTQSQIQYPYPRKTLPQTLSLTHTHIPTPTHNLLNQLS